MRIIKASELGSFLYCQRAWWYQLQDEPSTNQAQMDAGAQAHQSHARQVKLVPILIGLAMLLFLAGAIVYWIYR